MERYSLIFLLCFAIILAGCSNEEEEETTKEIIIDGSSTIFPITESIAEEFRTEHPDLDLSVSISGTGGGFKKFIQGDIDIINASRELSEDESQEATKQETEYVQLLIGYDGIAIVVNPQNDWVEYLTVGELEKIWRPSSQNTVTTWSDIREEWPDEELNLYAPGVASGTYEYFTEVIVGEAGSSRGDFTSSEDDNILVQGVASDQNALGYFGMGYYQNNQDQLKLIGVDDGVGQPFQATTEAVTNGNYTPLSRPLLLYVSREASERETVQRFVDFYLERAEAVVDQEGYVSLADTGYQAQRKKFEAFISEMDTTAVE